MTRGRLRVCLQPGCPTLTRESRCPVHQQQKRAVERRFHSGVPGVNYGRRWRKFRQNFLSENPLCRTCEESGRVEPATEVHHVHGHDGTYASFWAGPFEGLCKSCHSRATARQVLGPSG
jgi:5-methylcytosine-specific restriction enzyme A